MSYRTYVNGVQVFGNNEHYPEWLDFIREQGIEIGEENQYEGHITDFMGAMETVENIVLRIEKEILENRMSLCGHGTKAALLAEKRYPSLFDLTGIKRKLEDTAGDPGYRPRLFDELYDRIDNGYLFMPIMLYDACKDLLDLDLAHPDRFRAYKLKPGEKIHVKAS